MTTGAELSAPSALLAISVVTLVGAAAWFLLCPLERAGRAVMGLKALEPGSRRYKRIQRARLLSLGLCAAIDLYTVTVWTGIVRPN
ncbi:MAG: hypothetical protein NVSMB48_08110 [Marmoricola sp.]